jgi:hypothetical protein
MYQTLTKHLDTTCWTRLFYLGEFLKAAYRSPEGLLLHRTEFRIRGDVYLGYQILIIIHPASWIPDPTTETKREVGKIVVLSFLMTKIKENFK